MHFLHLVRFIGNTALSARSLESATRCAAMSGGYYPNMAADVGLKLTSKHIMPDRATIYMGIKMLLRKLY